jgi:Mce-associated membrane protein
MSRFVPRTLRGQADSDASEPPEKAGDRSSKPETRRDGREESEMTEHPQGVERTKRPKAGEAPAASDEAAVRDADETAEPRTTSPARNATKRPAARRRPSPAANGRRVKTEEPAEDVPATPDASPTTTEDTPDDVSDATDNAAPESAAADETDSGTKPRTTVKARSGRSGDERSGAARPKRQSGTGSTRKDSRGKPGRKVVAAPRTGSNRRARAQQAAISRLKRIALNLAVWTVVAALLAGAAWYFKHNGDEIDAASRDATSAATSAAQAIFSYDYRAFDESVSNGRDFVTGKFSSEYAKTTSGIKATVKKEKAIVRARVSMASVTEASSTRVEVLLFVNQYRRNVNITGEKVDQNRVLLTMVKVKGAWLVSDAAAI